MAAKKYVANAPLWSLKYEKYINPGEIVDTAHYTPDELRHSLERGDISEQTAETKPTEEK